MLYKIDILVNYLIKNGYSIISENDHGIVFDINNNKLVILKTIKELYFLEKIKYYLLKHIKDAKKYNEIKLIFDYILYSNKEIIYVFGIGNITLEDLLGRLAIIEERLKENNNPKNIKVIILKNNIKIIFKNTFKKSLSYKLSDKNIFIITLDNGEVIYL